MEKPLVSVCCIAYNHASYIRQALDSVLRQETEFPFEILIHDDASTDGTADVIKEYAAKYPDLIKPIYEINNQYSQGRNILADFLYPEIQGKYVALLECDDYWTNENKLQKQVDYMESHPKCSGTFHAAEWLLDGEIIKNDRHSNHEYDATPQQVIAGGGAYCATASLCFRKDYVVDDPPFRSAFGTGDYPLQILLSLRGDFHSFPDIMSCYRFCEGTSWTATIEKNRDKKIQHLRRENHALKLLDEYTQGQYSTEIYYRIIKNQCDLFVRDEIPFSDIQESFHHMRWGYMKIARMRRCYDRLLRKYIPGAKQKI